MISFAMNIFTALLSSAMHIEEVRKKLKPHCLNWGQGIIRGEGHPLINSVWGAYLDHLKGGRKQLGKSKPSDLRITRTEEYWKDSHNWSET